ncbi:hypothetical protein AURDEDRAFT_161542 [Auricularia subglabra TFB-10046 SS5]|nr:hypothetical protein AURDEDRAFT_161542 [Auricularia subglabra TFB-10046 SS5]
MARPAHASSPCCSPEQLPKLQRSYIQELPSELLCDIFAAIDDYGDLVTSTHICRHWRAVSLASPACLWADVSSVNKLPGVFCQTMARTQKAPARVTVVVGASNAEEVARVLMEHLFHIQTLIIHIETELDNPRAGRMAHALSVRAPLLRKLIILDEYSVIQNGFHEIRSNHSMDQLFDGWAPPRLTCFKLYGYPDGYAGLPALSNVHHAMYAPVGNALLLDELTAALRFGLFENLEMVTLWVGLGDWMTTFRIHIPPRLRALCLNVEHPRISALPLLRALDDHRAVPHIRIEYIHTCDPEVALEAMDYALSSAGRVVDLELDMSNKDLMLFRATTSTGMLREVHNLPSALRAASFATLTTLSISEWEWTCIDVFPFAPLLTHLTVLLVAPACMDPASAGISVFVDHDSRGVVHAPRLHTFGVSSRRRGDPALLGTSPALAPEMISRVLRKRLLYDRHKLPVLFMNGVRLIENLADQVIELLELIDDVQCGPGHPEPSSGLDDLSLWI